MNDNRCQRLARFALLAGASSGIAGGIGLLLLSFAISFETAKSYLDGLAYSGSAKFFTNAAFENMRHHVRLTGLLLCGISWLLLARKQAFRRLLERLFTRLRGDVEIDFFQRLGHFSLLHQALDFSKRLCARKLRQNGQGKSRQ